MYGISAARPSSRASAKAAAILSTPVAVPVASAIERLQTLQCLRQVLVSPAGKTQKVIARGARVLQQPGDRMGGLQGRHDSLQPGQFAEGEQGLLVGDRGVTGAARIAELGVLGAHARIVE